MSDRYTTRAAALEDQADAFMAQLAAELPPDQYSRVAEFVETLIAAAVAGVAAAASARAGLAAPPADGTPCPSCRTPLPPAVRTGFDALRAQRGERQPDGDPRPDLLGLTTWLMGALEHYGDEEDEEVFERAFRN